MKRLLCIVLSMILLLSTPVTAQAASKKETTAVKKAVTTLLNANKNYDPKKIKSCFKNPDKMTCVWDDQWQKHIRKHNKAKFKYKIKKVTIKGKKASVRIYYETYDDYYAVWYAFKKMLHEENADNLYRYVKRFENNYQHGDSPGYSAYRDDIYTATITIPLVKVKGKWKVEKMTKNMKRMFDCGIQAAAADIEDDPTELLFFN